MLIMHQAFSQSRCSSVTKRGGDSAHVSVTQALKRTQFPLVPGVSICVQMGSLLLVMAHADTAVKATLCQPDTLKTLFSAIEYAPESLQLTALKAIKNLTTDPSMLEALQARSLWLCQT